MDRGEVDWRGRCFGGWGRGPLGFGRGGLGGVGGTGSGLVEGGMVAVVGVVLKAVTWRGSAKGRACWIAKAVVLVRGWAHHVSLIYVVRASPANEGVAAEGVCDCDCRKGWLGVGRCVVPGRKHGRKRKGRRHGCWCPMQMTVGWWIGCHTGNEGLEANMRKSHSRYEKKAEHQCGNIRSRKRGSRRKQSIRGEENRELCPLM